MPLQDDISENDGFLASQGEITFTIERVSADLSITQINQPRIMRGDNLIFIVETGLKEAKRETIPINVFVDIDLNDDGIAHDDIFEGSYRYIENGKSIISYLVPTDNTFQAGQYNFSVEIDEEWSSFTGSTYFLIDLVERTTLSITYYFPNSRTEGKHYIWEAEIVEFTLLDEDDKPLEVMIEDKNSLMIETNLNIHYQITNGRNIYNVVKVDLVYGNYCIEYTPTTYGFETCVVKYEGSRFFAPSEKIRRERVFRRPLILNFIDFHHDNDKKLSQIVNNSVFSQSPHSNKSFFDLFEDAKRDFYKIDPSVFASAVVFVNNLETGKIHQAGKINLEVLIKSFSMS